MTANYLHTILDYVREHNPMHYKKLKKNINFEDAEYVTRAEAFFGNYEDILKKEGKGLEYALDCYLRFCADTMVEQIKFFETGRYSSTSFDEVNQRVYNDPEVMGYHMYGLLVSQYLWEHHFEVLRYFYNNLARSVGAAKHILEVGGGHGLYTNEIIHFFREGFDFTMVDISETSINMSKNFVKSDVVSYIHEDIYKYEANEQFDFIIMGEVLEHVEDPLGLMKRLHYLAADGGTAFITTPCNSPTIDHIYLFRNPDEVRSLLRDAGWEITSDLVASSESKKDPDGVNPMIPVLYAAFLKKGH